MVGKTVSGPVKENIYKRKRGLIATMSELSLDVFSQFPNGTYKSLEIYSLP